MRLERDVPHYNRKKLESSEPLHTMISLEKDGPSWGTKKVLFLDPVPGWYPRIFLRNTCQGLHSWLTIRESLCPAWRSDAIASAWGEGRSQTVTFGCFCGRVDGNPVSVKGLGLMLKICFCFIPEIVFSASVVENVLSYFHCSVIPLVMFLEYNFSKICFCVEMSAAPDNWSK